MDVDTEVISLDTVREQLYNLITPVAAKYETKDEHWINGWDEGFSYCRECAEKEITELQRQHPNEEFSLGGGWGSEGDNEAFCETCHAPLDNSFTDYGAEQAMEHFSEYGFNPTSPCDCYVLLNVLGAARWEGGDLSEQLHALARKAISSQCAVEAKGNES